MSQGCVLVTGGAGYIGSHTVVELLNSTEYSVVVIDNLVNSKPGLCQESMKRVEKITSQSIPFYSCDLRDQAAVNKVFEKHSISCVIHFAGLKAVGESCQLPHLYYKTNVGAALALIEVMEKHNVRNIIFSSSATVYGEPTYLPLDENHATGSCTNPYGKSKYFIEEILQDIASADERWNIVTLRYFNPVGAHKSGTIGENPLDIPNNLMPYISQVAVGRRECLSVFGDDYDTIDGTGVRDYIHVVDLARGHIAALRKIEQHCKHKIYNLGTGRPYSVFQMITAFEKASGKPIPYKVTARRSGDTATVYANPSLAATELKWTADKDIDEMCEDTWRWQSLNPRGYSDEQNGVPHAL